MKILLFGSTGMLGNYVKSWLSREFEIISVLRNDFDIESKDWNKLMNIITELNKEDVIINCAGAIPQKECSIRKYIIVNTIFPHKLADLRFQI